MQLTLYFYIHLNCKQNKNTYHYLADYAETCNEFAEHISAT